MKASRLEHSACDATDVAGMNCPEESADSEPQIRHHSFGNIWPLSEPPDPDGLCAELCREYARLIVEYWKDCRVNAELDAQQCLDVIDLCPGSGLSCWLMMQAISRHAGHEFRFRYLPLAPQRAWFSSWLNTPEFSSSVHEGVLAPLVWESVESDPYFIGQAGEAIWQPHNPLVILTHDRFRYLHQRLFAVHYGRLLEADFSSTEVESQHALSDPENTTSKKKKDELNWKAVNRTEEELQLGIRFDRYVEKFNSSPLPVPAGALQFIKKFHPLASRGYLLVSMGCGMSTEQDVRMASYSSLVDEIRTKETLPVNFHMVGQLFSNHNVCHLSRKMQNGRVLHAAVASQVSNPQDRLSRLFVRSDETTLLHTDALIEATRSLGSAAALPIRSALLELSDFDPAVFVAGHKALTAALASAAQGGTLDKRVWRHALEQVWSRYLPAPQADRLHQYLAPAAMHCGAWGLAKRALVRGMACFGESSTDLANLAWCESRTGNADLAHALVHRALHLDPASVLANEVRRRVDERLVARDDRWRCVLRDADSGLVLEPLDSSHADALFYQYRDPQIAIMTGLPPMKSREEAMQWIAEQGTDDKKINYAIMLPDEGFAGFINLAVSEHAAFFCFWSGVDFQGRGLAGLAGTVACQHAIRSGVTIILTSAFNDNQRSIKALRRMGFSELPIRALPPDNDRIFFILDHENSVTSAQGIRELIDYYARENLSLHFPPTDDGIAEDALAVSSKESS